MEERKENRRQKHNAGITLIALIITIIILLILAMITIRILMNQGIIKHAQNATEAYNEAQNNELELLAYQESIMDKYAGGASAGTDEDNSEIAKIRKGYNKYMSDKAEINAQIEQAKADAISSANQTDLELLREYCIGNNDKDLLQDVLEDPNNMIFKNMEPIPNASEELTVTNMEQAEINGGYEIYIYFTYNGETYKLTAEVEESGDSYTYPTKNVEPAVDTSELSNQLSSITLSVQDATVNGDEDSLWIISFTDTENKYWMNAEGVITKFTDLDLLKAYFLGIDKDGSYGSGQYIWDLAYKGKFRSGGIGLPAPFKDNDIINDARTSVVPLDTYLANSGSYLYVKYKNKAYRISVSNTETTNVELVYEPKGLEGTKKTYNGEQWTVLYDKGDSLELVSPNTIGTYTIGSDAPNAVGNDRSEKAIDSYNNAVSRLNNYCRTVLNDNTARCVGSDPNNPNSDNPGMLEHEKFASWFGGYFEGKVKKGDDNAEQDYVRMCYWGEITPTDNQEYWLASRRTTESANEVIRCYVMDNMLIEGDFSHRYTLILGNVGVDYKRESTYGVRACVTVDK